MRAVGQPSNTGTVATTAVSTITDTIPTGLTSGTLPAGCAAAGQTVTCTVAAGLAGGGSTTTLVYHLYEEAFSRFHMGYASAVAYLLFGVSLLLAWLQSKPP